MAGEDEHRCAEGRIRPPYLSFVEHSSAHHVSPGPGVPLRDDLIVSVGLAAVEALTLAPALQIENPSMDQHTPIAQGIVWTGVRPGDVSVE
jgi:hypothetical protein